MNALEAQAFKRLIKENIEFRARIELLEADIDRIKNPPPPKLIDWISGAEINPPLTTTKKRGRPKNGH